MGRSLLRTGMPKEAKAQKEDAATADASSPLKVVLDASLIAGSSAVAAVGDMADTMRGGAEQAAKGAVATTKNVGHVAMVASKKVGHGAVSATRAVGQGAKQQLAGIAYEMKDAVVTRQKAPDHLVDALTPEDRWFSPHRGWPLNPEPYPVEVTPSGYKISRWTPPPTLTPLADHDPIDPDSDSEAAALASDIVGEVRVEVLQCEGLPKLLVGCILLFASFACFLPVAYILPFCIRCKGLQRILVGRSTGTRTRSVTLSAPLSTTLSGILTLTHTPHPHRSPFTPTLTLHPSPFTIHHSPTPTRSTLHPHPHPSPITCTITLHPYPHLHPKMGVVDPYATIVFESFAVTRPGP